METAQEGRVGAARGRGGFVDRYFRDPTTGRVVLYERPNAPLALAGTLSTTARVLRLTRAVHAGDRVDVLLERAATVALLWWGVDETLRGSTRYRQTIGAISLTATVVRAVRAELRRARAT